MRRWALPGLAAMAAITAPAAAQDWNTVYERTAQGHRIGNPDAELQLIEFVSYTCPHCAHFERESEAELRYFYVHEGHASVEVRHLVRNIIDLAAVLTAECGPEENFFGNHNALLFTQPEWLARAQSATPGQQQRWNSGTVPSRLQAIANDLEFYELMEVRGYSVPDINRCLNDFNRADAVVAASQTNAAEFGVQGTPSFVLNGALLDQVHSWPTLRAALATRRAPAEESIFD